MFFQTLYRQPSHQTHISDSAPAALVPQKNRPVLLHQSFAKVIINLAASSTSVKEQQTHQSSPTSTSGSEQ
jgi:hypothetical protein